MEAPPLRRGSVVAPGEKRREGGREKKKQGGKAGAVAAAWKSE